MSKDYIKGFERAMLLSLSVNMKWSRSELKMRTRMLRIVAGKKRR